MTMIDHDLGVFAMAMMIVILKMVFNNDVDLSNIAGKRQFLRLPMSSVHTRKVGRRC